MPSSKKIARAVVLALLVMSSVAVVSLRAEDKSGSPDRRSPDQPQVSNDTSQNAGGIGKHETREAAGEEKDETAEFKESASVRLIAKYLTGGNLRSAYWTSVALNFAVIAGIIFWAGRKFLPGLMRDRTASIQKAMQEAQKASEEARRKLAEIEARLGKLDAEIAAMREAAEKEGGAEEARIQAAAQEDARKVVAQAEQEIAAAAKAARRQLTAHAADLAVALAQKQIQVDAATDKELVRSFSGQLSVTPDNPGKDRN